MTTTLPPIQPLSSSPVQPPATARDVWMQSLNPKIQDIITMVKAKTGVIFISTTEEARVLNTLDGAARMLDFLHEQAPVRRWSMTEGLVTHDSDTRAKIKAAEETMDPVAALHAVMAAPANEGVLFVFRDLHQHWNNPEVIRLMRDIAQRLPMTNNSLIVLGASLTVPPDLAGDVVLTDWPYPSMVELRRLLAGAYKSVVRSADKTHRTVDENPDLKERIVRALSGLTDTGAQNAIARAIVEHGGINEAAVESINKAKRDSIKKIGCLEWIESAYDLSVVGGLDHMKAWVRKRKDLWSREAAEFGCAAPRGMVAVGVPGGGKSLSAVAVANVFQLPLLRLDMGAVFGGIVGESEGNLRTALKIVEAAAPAILWVDEVEKGAAGVGSSDKSDGGTSARVFGTFLTWLSERGQASGNDKAVFVYFTANNTDALPPELLRKGRVDEIFFIDLPNTAERTEILSIHLKKRKRDAAQFDLPTVSRACVGFVGSEIEQVVADALVEAFSDGRREMTTEDLVRSCERTVPLVRTQRQKIDGLRRLVTEGRAVRASSGESVDLSEAFFAQRTTAS